MRRPFALAIAGFLHALVAAGAEELPFLEEAAIRAAVARVAPAVVRIETGGVSAAGLATGTEAAPASGPSTGVVVDAGGWVVTTSFAVPRDVEQAIVILPPVPAAGDDAAAAPAPGGRRLAARVAGRDLARGLVLLRVEETGPDLPFPAPISDWVPRNELAVGQWTIAVGRGWSSTAANMAVGILSAVNRSWGRSVQTDASVSPANYGGLLVDIRGRAIGILAPLPADTAGMNLGTELYDSGIGFAVPFADLVRVLPRMQQGASLAPGIVGIGYASRDAFTGEPRIATCRSGSPAAKAGLRVGDLIVAADGRPVSRIAELRHAIAPLYAGDVVRFTVERAAAGAAGEAAAPPPARTRLDIPVELAATLPPWRRPFLGIVPVRSTGRNAAAAPVKVAWVWPDSPAARAGIAAGDVIESVTPPVGEGDAAADTVRVTSAAGLAGVVAGIDVGRPVGLGVLRGDRRQTIRVESVAMDGNLATGFTDQVPPFLSAEPAAARPNADATVERLEAAEVAQPPLAVLPPVGPREPLGVLVFLDVPRGPADESQAVAWKAAATRYGVAVVLPGSADSRRWGREDIAAIKRGLATLSSKRAIDPTRIAVAGRGAGGAFAWLVAEAIGPVARGVALIDASLPRQASVEPAEPGRSRWVLFAGSAENAAASRVEADRRRLAEAGLVAGVVAAGAEAAAPADWLAAWVEALGGM